MSVSKRAVLIILVLCSCVGCDQVTKTVARNHLTVPQPIHALGGLFRFQYTENTGAFLGLGARLPEPVRFWLLIVLVGGVLIGMLRFVCTSQEINSPGILGGSLVVGGGISNLIDRIFNAGAVVDFMDMGVGNLRTGIVNVADVAITVGVGMLLASSLFFGHSEKGNTQIERV
jgi:signal peptidase II